MSLETKTSRNKKALPFSTAKMNWIQRPNDELTKDSKLEKLVL